MASFPESEERYNVSEVLTSRPLASVARAADRATGVEVVLKRFTPGEPLTAERAQRFLAAMGSLAGVRHPALPVLLDCGISPAGSLWLSFEPVPGAEAGRDLATFAGVVGAPPTQILPLLLEAAGALQALADRGLAHHNLSLDNLVALAGPAGGAQEGDEIAVFGLGTGILRTGPPTGPAAPFAAPELAVPAEVARADWRADLFSLALATCRLLEARVEGAGTPSPAIALPLAVSFELEDAETLERELERCLWRDPRERPGSFEDLRRALRRALPEQPATVPQARLTFVTITEDADGIDPAVAGPEAEEDSGDSTNPVLSLEDLQPAQPPVAQGGPPEPLDLELTINHPPPVPAPPPPEIAPVKLDTAVFVPPPAPRTAPPPPPPVSGGSAAIFPFPPLPNGEREEEVGLLRSAVVPEPPAAPRSDLLPGLDESMSATAADLALRPPVPPPAARRPPGRLPLVIALAAAGLLAVAAILLWLGRPAEEAAVAGPAAPGSPGTTATPTGAVLTASAGQAALHPAIAAAAAAFAAGDEPGARRALAALGTGTGLSAGDCWGLLSLGQAMGLARVERLAGDLGRGIESGDVPLLASLARAVPAREEATLVALAGGAGLARDLALDLAEARRAADLYGRLQAAEKAGDPTQVLETAGAVAAAFPLWAEAGERRQQAASSLETEADALLESGDTGAALGRLEALERAWPERPGLAERLARLGAERRSEQSVDQVLAAAAAAEARRRPDEGLALLRNTRATPRLEGKLRETRARLERQLAELDRGAPEITLPAALPEIEKGAPAKVRFQVSDDYQVAAVTARARPEGGAWSDLPVARSGADWMLEIPPALHGNRPVELTVAATDLSGHRAEAGPSQLKRKRWFQKLRPRRGGDAGDAGDTGEAAEGGEPPVPGS